MFWLILMPTLPGREGQQTHGRGLTLYWLDWTDGLSGAPQNTTMVLRIVKFINDLVIIQLVLTAIDTFVTGLLYV